MNNKEDKNTIQTANEEYTSEEIRKMKLTTAGIAAFGGLAALVGFGNAASIDPESRYHMLSMILGYSGAITAVTGFAGTLYFHALDRMKNKEPMNLETYSEKTNFTTSQQEELLLTDRLGRDIMIFSGPESGYGSSDYKRLIREMEGYSRGR